MTTPTAPPLDHEAHAAWRDERLAPRTPTTTLRTLIDKIEADPGARAAGLKSLSRLGREFVSILALIEDLGEHVTLADAHRAHAARASEAEERHTTLVREISDLVARQKALDGILTDLHRRIAAARTDLDEVTRKAAEARAFITAAQDAEGRLATATKQLADVDARMAALRKSLGSK
jgi:chromosome segregation ATPase